MEPLISPSSSHEKLPYNPRDSEEQFNFDDRVDRKQSTTSTRALIFCALSLILLSIFGLLIGIYHRLGENRKCNCSEMNDVGSNLLVNDDLSLIGKVARPYHYLEAGYDIDDFEAADPIWGDLFPEGAGLVYLSQEYITSRRLPFSAVSSDRPGNKSVYEIAGYHSLHCVSALRANLWRAHGALTEGKPFDIEEYWYHVVHCLADLRQYIMCNFDETLLRVTDFIHHPGLEQMKVCTDTGPIDRWLEKNFQ